MDTVPIQISQTLGGLVINIKQIIIFTRLSETSLCYACGVLGIDVNEDIESEDIKRIHRFLEKNGGYSKDSLFRLLRLATKPVENTTSVGRLRPGVGSVLTAGFFRSRVEDKKLQSVHRDRNTRNCGDTAALIAHNLKAHVQKNNRGISLDQFVKALKNRAGSHVVWQISIHLHTFSIERSNQGENMLVQSYQSTVGTYSVQWWCGFKDNAYVDSVAASACTTIREEWLRPSDQQLIELADMIERFYSAEKTERAEIWAEMPFHPLDGGKLLKTNEVAFAAEMIELLATAKFPAMMQALRDGLG